MPRKSRTGSSCITALEVGCVAVTIFAATTAQANDTHRFDQPRESFSQAAIDLAVTADISLGGEDPAVCGKMAPALHGEMSTEQALRHLLSGSACEFERINAHTFRLRRKHVGTPAPMTAPMPSVVKPETVAAPQEVIVTGFRRRQTLGSAPASLSVIGRDTLATYPDGLNAVAARVPGFTTTNLGPGRDKILLRGLSDGVFTGRTQSTVGLYLDETPITFDAPDPDLLLIDMAHIEVLKGPQGALYGEGSISGVVRLVTNKPTLDAFSGTISAGLALTQSGAPSSRVSGVMNVPLIHEQLAIRLVGYDDRAGGYIDDLALGRQDINKTRRFGGRASALWKVNDQWQVTGKLAAQAIDNRNSQYVSGDLGTYRRAISLAEPHDNDFNEGVLTARGEVAWGTLNISLSHLHHHLTSRYLASDIATLLSQPPSSQPLSSQLAYDEEQQVELLTQEVSLVSPSDRRLRWLGGLYSAASHETFLPQLTDLAAGRSLYDERRLDRISDRAAFGEVTFDVTPKWQVTGGLRGTWNRHSTRSDVSEAGSSRSLDLRQSTYHLSHTLALRYQPGSDLSGYLMVSEGYRSGGFNTTRLASQTILPETYQGDELNNYEAGVRIGLPDHRASVNLALFRVAWSNIQSDQLQASGLPVTVNIGDGANTGVEVEASWQPRDDLKLNAVAQINDSHLTHADPAYVVDDRSGLPLISKISGSVSGEWTAHVGRGDLRLSAMAAYRGASRLNFSALQQVEMDGYARLDMASTYTFDAVTLSMRLDNATNTAGNSFAYGNPFSLARMPQVTPLRPRTLWFSVAVDY